MRKTRLVILPAKCLNHMGFLLLFLSCPVIGDWGRIRPDSEMSHRAIQIEREGTCALQRDPPGIPGMVFSDGFYSCRFGESKEMNGTTENLFESLLHMKKETMPDISLTTSVSRNSRMLSLRREERMSRSAVQRASSRRLDGQAKTEEFITRDENQRVPLNRRLSASNRNSRVEFRRHHRSDSERRESSRTLRNQQRDERKNLLDKAERLSIRADRKTVEGQVSERRRISEAQRQNFDRLSVARRERTQNVLRTEDPERRLERRTRAILAQEEPERRLVTQRNEDVRRKEATLERREKTQAVRSDPTTRVESSERREYWLNTRQIASPERRISERLSVTRRMEAPERRVNERSSLERRVSERFSGERRMVTRERRVNERSSLERRVEEPERRVSERSSDERRMETRERRVSERLSLERRVEEPERRVSERSLGERRMEAQERRVSERLSLTRRIESRERQTSERMSVRRRMEVPERRVRERLSLARRIESPERQITERLSFARRIESQERRIREQSVARRQDARNSHAAEKILRTDQRRDTSLIVRMDLAERQVEERLSAARRESTHNARRLNASARRIDEIPSSERDVLRTVRRTRSLEDTRRMEERREIIRTYRNIVSGRQVVSPQEKITERTSDNRREIRRSFERHDSSPIVRQSREAERILGQGENRRMIRLTRSFEVRKMEVDLKQNRNDFRRSTTETSERRQGELLHLRRESNDRSSHRRQGRNLDASSEIVRSARNSMESSRRDNFRKMLIAEDVTPAAERRENVREIRLDKTLAIRSDERILMKGRQSRTMIREERRINNRQPLSRSEHESRNERQNIQARREQESQIVRGNSRDQRQLREARSERQREARLVELTQQPSGFKLSGKPAVMDEKTTPLKFQEETAEKFPIWSHNDLFHGIKKWMAIEEYKYSSMSTISDWAANCILGAAVFLLTSRHVKTI